MDTLNLETAARNPSATPGKEPQFKNYVLYHPKSGTTEMAMFYCHGFIHLADLVILIFFCQEKVVDAETS